MRVAVLGGAGFIGSHLCDAFVARGDEVIAIDDLSSGSLQNIAHLQGNKAFSFTQSDITNDLSVDGPIDAILNFASLASPPRYMSRRLHTLRTGSIGTENGLKLALQKGARFLQASTSEVYGDPTEHPQRESYNGNVNPIGPRSCYDEAKRYAEALCMAFQNEYAADVRIVRIFNTYGPRLDPQDGRVVSNFITQALAGVPLTVYGSGTQTRSFCFVTDEVDGILRLLESDYRAPVNIGNPGEFTMLELASLVLEITGSKSELIFEPLPQDDPIKRQPDISLAIRELGWQPTVALQDGLAVTIDWFKGLKR
jgi:nucleoside-diphosphate-sugar epimerase